jgi:nicotinate-nucleotide adenylyltransferase
MMIVAAHAARVLNRDRWAHRRVGLLGGSFNPAHAGHTQISKVALKRLKLDAVWWLVSPQNPLKSQSGMASQALRLASTQVAEEDPRILPTAIETTLGTQFTADTLRALAKRYPHTHFVWLMGADNLAGFHRWRDWQSIVRRWPIAIIPRLCCGPLVCACGGAFCAIVSG